MVESTLSLSDRQRARSVAALIVTWNGADDTIALLESLRDCQCDSLSLTAVVIDNASSSDDLDKLRSALSAFTRHFPIVCRVNAVNVGVPAAYNQAIQLAGLEHDYYLRLDSDVVVEPGALSDMVVSLERHAESGVSIVGGNVKYFDRRDQDNGGAISFDLVAGKTTVAYPASDVVCDGVLGCIMLISGRLVKRYAPDVFEGALFLCTDESELSMRAASDGHRTLYRARVIGFHKGAKSTGTVKFVSNYYAARNWTLHRLRYVHTAGQVCSVLIRLIVDVFRALLRGRWASVPGLVVGVALAGSWYVDRAVRRGRC